MACFPCLFAHSKIFYFFSFNSHNMSAAAVEEKPKVEKKAAAKKPKAKDANATEYPLEV